MPTTLEGEGRVSLWGEGRAALCEGEGESRAALCEGEGRAAEAAAKHASCVRFGRPASSGVGWWSESPMRND